MPGGYPRIMKMLCASVQLRYAPCSMRYAIF
jgi:hypothetical protein